MKYLIGSDHAGYELKEQIKKSFKAIEFEDVGCEEPTRVDYTDFANIVGQRIADDPKLKAILVCGTGIGMSIAVNKHNGVRAALCMNSYMAKMSRLHNDSNVLCLGARVSGDGLVEAIVYDWLNTEFEGGRHQQRLDKIIG